MKKQQNDNVSAIDMLEAQHREVEELFDQFDELAEDDPASENAYLAARTICDRLTQHAVIEEEIFYPAARTQDTEDLVAEAAVEHLSVKRLIADVEAMSAGDEMLKATVSVLQEQVEHHVEEEEQSLFPQVSQDLSSDELDRLAEQMRERLTDLQETSGKARNGRAKTIKRPSPNV
ncbi:MAG: hemerythrin domain-containing protein [Deltaproteobacteria bacterium]|nr:hemerythrin domain-containing protein [Deltaproteobacteria bacterium]